MILRFLEEAAPTLEDVLLAAGETPYLEGTILSYLCTILVFVIVAVSVVRFVYGGGGATVLLAFWLFSAALTLSVAKRAFICSRILWFLL